METVGEWVLLEGAVPPTLDMVKVKQIAKLILEMSEETVISEEQAGLTVGTWIYETVKDNQSVALNLVVETTKQPEGTSTPHPTRTDNQKITEKLMEFNGVTLMCENKWKHFSRKGIITKSANQRTNIDRLRKMDHQRRK
ncbi:hypothetical protein SNF32_12840 [Enterococcus mundtii]|nr:hypothetical protein [Enterococcus mundtii]